MIGGDYTPKRDSLPDMIRRTAIAPSGRSIIISPRSSVLGDQSRVNFQIVFANHSDIYIFLSDQTDYVLAIVIGVEKVVIYDDAFSRKRVVRQRRRDNKDASGVNLAVYKNRSSCLRIGVFTSFGPIPPIAIAP